MKLKFVADAFVNGEVVYLKGQVVDVPNETGSADRWLRRGLAEPFVEAIEPKVEHKEEVKGPGKKKKSIVEEL